MDLAHAVDLKPREQPKEFKFLYDLDGSVQERIEAIGTKMYGAKGEWSSVSKAQGEGGGV